MANNNGLITAPVRMIADVKAVLGVNSNNLSALCTSNQINPWARYKPVSFPTLTAITDAQRLSANYGFNIPVTTNGLLTDLWLKLATWVYSRPRGGESSPYRLGDFNGYFHNATNVMPTLPDSQTVHTVGVNTPLAIAVNFPFLQTDGGTNKYIISPADFAPFRNGIGLDKAYLGLWLSNGSTTLIGTNTLSGVYTPLKVTMRSLPSGTWNARLFAAAQPITRLTVETDIEVCALYSSKACQITFDSSTSADGWVIRLNGSLQPQYNTDGTPSGFWSIRYSLSFISSSSRTFPNMQLSLLAGNSVSANRLDFINLGNVAVAADNPADFTGFFNPINAVPTTNTSLFVYVESLTDTRYKRGPIQCFVPVTFDPLNPDI